MSIVISVKLDLSTIKTSLITSSLSLPVSGNTLFITILVVLWRTELKFSISIFPVLLVPPSTKTSYDTDGFKDDLTFIFAGLNIDVNPYHIFVLLEFILFSFIINCFILNL